MHGRSWRNAGEISDHCGQLIFRLPRTVSVRLKRLSRQVDAFGSTWYPRSAGEVQNSAKRQPGVSREFASTPGSGVPRCVAETANALSNCGSGQDPTTSILPSNSTTPGCQWSKDPASVAPCGPGHQRGLWLAKNLALTDPLIELGFRTLSATSPEWVGITRSHHNSIPSRTTDRGSRLLELVGGDVSYRCGVDA